MATRPINIGVLTSSRADFGIYLPMLKKIRADEDFNLIIIAFGSHLSRFHGYTVDVIEKEGFKVDFRIDSLLTGDSPEAIATSMSLTMLKFSQFWGEHAKSFDLVVCLGDRYEMFSAVSAAAPCGVKFAHLHGGEKTLGAIDNFFRHSISHTAWCHFVSTQHYADRLKQMLDVPERIFNVGALSLDSLKEIPFLTKSEIRDRWGIDLSRASILVTFHPETIDADRNIGYAYELVKVFRSIPDFQIIITMPNADTYGSSIRAVFEDQLKDYEHIKMVDNFGTQGYFSLMHYCSFLLGNTSSGIIEAASFGKYVINIGERQSGRLQSANVTNVPIDSVAIIEAIKEVSIKGIYEDKNIYFQNGAAYNILSTIKVLLS